MSLVFISELIKNSNLQYHLATIIAFAVLYHILSKKPVWLEKMKTKDSTILVQHYTTSSNTFYNRIWRYIP